jgi:hypothetical protein
MLRTEPDGGGDPVPPPPKPGGSSPPPNGGSSPKNQPSNSDNGKKPEAGKNKNTKQPVAKKPAATQPVTAPKGETLEQAISRMRDQDLPEWQVKAQIQKWHPTWTDAQITRTMKAAPAPGGYIDKAKANAAKGNSSGSGGGIKALERDVRAVERIATSVGRVSAQTAASVASHDDRYLRDSIRYAKVVARELEAHPADVAVVASLLALASPPGLAFALLVIAAEASREAGNKAFRHGQYVEGALDYASVVAGGVGALGKLGEVVAQSRVASGSARLAQLGREAQTAPLTSAPPLTESERDALTHAVEEEVAARKAAHGHREIELKAAIATALTALEADPRFKSRRETHRHG